VNYETLERTLKESARFYSELIRSNGEALTARSPLSTIARP
jgi:beta-glucosidase/6-phospho-beta-glucosidase/beta-galactosidase